MKTKNKIRGHILRSAAYAALFSCVVVGFSSGFNLPGRWTGLSSRFVLSDGVLKPATQTKTLAFADRVAYQRAIEEVYWRHRIWPKERPDSKPSLDEVMSQAQMEKKVKDYLRNSQALEDYWHQPLGAEQLQAEMDRMAQHTRQPNLLRELFEALGSDPFVVAECLARPVLSERLVTNFSADDKQALESRRAAAENQKPELMAAANASYTLPEMSDRPNGCIDDTWTATSTTDAPSARLGHTAVWTGSEMIVWGGFEDNGLSNSGGRYDPSTDSWIPTSTTNAPSARLDHTAVWIGSEMIVWGGTDFNAFFNTGGRYNPITDTWAATTTLNAPEARHFHTAVWTGSEMIVWGGTPDNSSNLNTGGRYDPGTDSWTATSTINAPEGRTLLTALWTGSEMIVWGGADAQSGMGFNTGGKYNPITDSWAATSTTDAPSAREFHTAVWTGDEMIVWGGLDASGFSNIGGKYDPGTDSWTATSTTGAPFAREGHTAVWTGSEMIVWGGTSDFLTGLNTGGRYAPGTGSWTATSTTDAPDARLSHTAVWTGSEMIVWGGDNDVGSLNTGGRYCAQFAPPSPTPTPTLKPTPTATATPTPSATPAPRVTPTPRPRPDPRPRGKIGVKIRVAFI